MQRPPYSPSPRRRPSAAPRVGAVVATVALALGTAFMQPMHAASYPLDATEVVAQAAATVAASPGAPSAGRMEQRLGQPSVLPAQTHGR